MTAHHTPGPGWSRRRATLVVGVLVLVGVLGTGSALWAAGSDNGTPLGSVGKGAQAQRAADAKPAPLPVVAIKAVQGGLVPWSQPLVLTATGGTISTVAGTDPQGKPVVGAVRADGTWSSDDTLIPAAAYRLTADVVDAAGRSRKVTVTATTSPAERVVKAALSPGDGKVVGVGQPVIVRFDRAVESRADRDTISKRLSVSTRPATTGAWRWMSETEMHYRAAKFWKSGTTINVKSDLSQARLSGGVWGSGSRTSSFTVGDAVASVVDVKAHTMTVSRNGTVLRTMKASMGRAGFDTRGGTFLVLEKWAEKVMDGSTLAVPADYSTKVKDAVRISNSGTFAHGAPWSVASQGRSNVSHGCINLSPADAAWYFKQTKRGDVVTVINAAVPPLSQDAGSQDWNMSFTEWKRHST